MREFVTLFVGFLWAITSLALYIAQPVILPAEFDFYVRTYNLYFGICLLIFFTTVTINEWVNGTNRANVSDSVAALSVFILVTTMLLMIILNVYSVFFIHQHFNTPFAQGTAYCVYTMATCIVSGSIQIIALYRLCK